MMLFSPTTLSFYDDRIHDDIPHDVVTVTDDRFRECLAARVQNKKIIPDSNGYPIAIDANDPPESLKNG